MQLISSLFIIFLFAAVIAYTKPATVTNIEKNNLVQGQQVNILSIDTTGTQSMEKILGLNAGIIVLSGVVEFSRGGEILKMPYNPGNFNKIWTQICRTRPKDKVFFTNIIVKEGDKRYKIADKTFVIK